PGSTAARGGWECPRRQIQCPCGKPRSLLPRRSLRQVRVLPEPFRPSRTGRWQPTSGPCSWRGNRFARALSSSEASSPKIRTIVRKTMSQDTLVGEIEDVIAITSACDLMAGERAPEDALAVLGPFAQQAQ